MYNISAMTNILIPLAGEGTRFKDNGEMTPKPLIEVNGKTLIEHSIESLGIDGKYIFITKEYENPEYNKRLKDILDTYAPGHVQKIAHGKQYGAAYSAMLARDYIDCDDDLIITNCDQRLEWDGQKFLKTMQQSLSDGCVVLYKNTDPKHSFAEVVGNRIVSLAEKDPISDNALIGMHYWKRGCDFIDSAQRLIEDLRGSSKESYISLTYNYLLEDNKKIIPYFIEEGGFIPLGTPADVERYLNEQRTR